MSISSAAADANSVLAQVRSKYSNPKKVHIADDTKLQEIVEGLKRDGPNLLQVISDFDMTLTRFHKNGEPCHSCHGILDYSPLMPEDFRKKNEELRHKYYPIEIDHSISIQDKIPFMEEWYKQSHANLAEAGMNKFRIKDIIAQSRAILRDDVPLMMTTLKKADVPLLIFSAGIGDMVEAVLEQNDLVHEDEKPKIVSNYMIFNEDGQLVGFKKPLIHMYNKSETHAHHPEYFDQLAHRHNAILLGDSLGDVQMAASVNGKGKGKVLKIGFLNDKIPERLESFKDAFDIVLEDDQSMEFINLLLKALL